MARPIRSTADLDGLRNQTLANLRAINFITSTPGEYDIIIARKPNVTIAWVARFTHNTRKPIMRGPASGSCEEALEGLLEATAEMVQGEMEKEFEEFAASLSLPAGGGFVLEELWERGRGGGGGGGL